MPFERNRSLDRRATRSRACEIKPALTLRDAVARPKPAQSALERARRVRYAGAVMRTTSDTALIVVDVQESFRHSTYWSEADVPAFLAAVQRLTDDAARAGVPVVQILHVQPEGAFARESGYVRALDGYRIAPDVTFHKTHHSAFAGTDLQAWLTEHGVTRVVVCGIRTEQCCETTSRHASDLGYAVDYVTDATLTFPMTHPRTGRTYSPAEIKERTELVLEGRFATIARAADAFSPAVAAAR